VAAPLPLRERSCKKKICNFFETDILHRESFDTDPDDTNKSMLDGNNLGATGELQWLENGLLTSTARWKIIFTSVVINPTTKITDGWGGFQTEWNALKDFINTHSIQGVVFISGDLHLGAIDNGTNAGFAEMCVSQPNGLGDCPTAQYGTWSEGYDEDGTCKGFGLVTVSTDPNQLTLQARDEFGKTKISYTLSDPPVITVQPHDVTVRVGQRGRFSVTATGTPPLFYQWKKNGANIAGANRALYATPPVTQADNGSVFAVIVSNSGGSVTSTNATLTVRPGASPTPTPTEIPTPTATPTPTAMPTPTP
jgi:hypothetical protein